MWTIIVAGCLLMVVTANGNPIRPACTIKTWSNHEITEQTSAKVGKLVIIRCDASCVGEGYPPALKWYGPGKKHIPEVPGRVFTAPYRSHRVLWLFIQSFSERDVGQYMCSGWIGDSGWTRTSIDVTMEAEENISDDDLLIDFFSDEKEDEEEDNTAVEAEFEEEVTQSNVVPEVTTQGNVVPSTTEASYSYEFDSFNSETGKETETEVVLEVEFETESSHDTDTDLSSKTGDEGNETETTQSEDTDISETDTSLEVDETETVTDMTSETSTHLEEKTESESTTSAVIPTEPTQATDEFVTSSVSTVETETQTGSTSTEPEIEVDINDAVYDTDTLATDETGKLSAGDTLDALPVSLGLVDVVGYKDDFSDELKIGLPDEIWQYFDDIDSMGAM